jgi:hypothetical protein
MKTTADSAPIIGLDSGKHRHSVCVLDAAGESLAEHYHTNTRAARRGAAASIGPA